MPCLACWWADEVRIAYRARQFWHALTRAPDPNQLEQARQALSPELMALFQCLQASEQAHSLAILNHLHDQSINQEDLMVAALLHDVGKSRYPLRLWERILIVLGEALFPGQARKWGQGEPRGWRRAFVVAQQHPMWGAEMAAQAGATPLAVTLIRRHQEQLDPAVFTQAGPSTLEDRLLLKLQVVDDES
jgi:hypothetical protein